MAPKTKDKKQGEEEEPANPKPLFASESDPHQSHTQQESTSRPKNQQKAAKDCAHWWIQWLNVAQQIKTEQEEDLLNCFVANPNFFDQASKKSKSVTGSSSSRAGISTLLVSLILLNNNSNK